MRHRADLRMFSLRRYGMAFCLGAFVLTSPVFTASTFAVDDDDAGASVMTTVVFFRQPGCGDCEAVRQLLTDMETLYPQLRVEEYSIRTPEGMRLNEAYAETFAVPEKRRLVAPSVFAAAGALIKEDITYVALSDLIMQSQGVPVEEWYVSADRVQETAAESSITNRYAALNLGIIVAAGLLDSINPCAFATLIFFISYLQVSGRRPRQTVELCLAFIGGVFVTYFVLGLGLAEVIARFEVIERFSSAVNWLMAVFVGIIVVLNIRDGVLCLRGRYDAMTLQLPDPLKRRIHSVIRKGTRHSRFVMAAFVVGVFISILELACTGQVYAPTILYMIKTGGAYASALGYLVVYNLAFVAPLIAILALTWYGLRSETLTRLLHRHAATVKFATAALFLVLLVAFLYSF